MGLFDMFKNKEKINNNSNKSEKEIINDEVFGNISRLGQVSDWYTEEYKLNLFNNEYKVQIALEVNDDDSSITDKQHIAGKNFIENIDKYQKTITKEIMNFFNTDDYNKVYNSISVDSVRVSRIGNVCVLMNCLEDADESLFSGIAKDVIFTDSFGIKIYPEVKILPNEEEVTFNAFDY